MYHEGVNGCISLPVAIRLPVESILLPAPRAVSNGAGDGATAVSIVVMATKAVGVQ